jgi:hypothetical protein
MPGFSLFRNEYRDLVEASASIREFLEKIYNEKRLRSALGYLPQAEIERSVHARTTRMPQGKNTRSV